MEKSCKVCHDGMIMQGKHFCEACRTFFRRMRKPGSEEPVCRTGLFQCLLKEKDFRRQDGSCFRFLCPACRYEKCLAVSGLPSKFNEKHIKKSAVHSMHDRDNEQFEMMLATIMMATMNLSNDVKHIPMKQMTMNVEKPIENYRQFIQSFDQQFSLIKNFGSKFPLFLNFSNADRINFFMTTRFRVLSGDGLIQPDDFYLACFPSSKVAKVFGAIPTHFRMKSLFKTAYNEAYNSWNRIKEMNLTPVEKAFFIIFVFFDGKILTFEK